MMRIVFTRSLNSTDYNVMVVGADGSGERQLTTRAGHDGEASWSPDGRKIIYAATYHNRGPYPFTMSPNGKGVKPLLPPRVMAHGSPIGAGEPAWRPSR